MSKGFFNWVKADGSSDFKPEKGRYHLYVAMVCPFAGRALAVWKLKGLEDVVSISVLDSVKPKGTTWKFSPEKPGCDEDTVNGFTNIKELYYKADSKFNGAFSVPLLWDKKTSTAVNNESIDIMRMFNKEFNAFCATEEQRNLDLLPDDMKDRIEDINSWVAPNINLGVYKVGRADNQESYDKNVSILFDHLDKAELLLSQHRYLAGDKMTEADVRLFTTVVRFDVVYYGAFKCNLRRIQDYPNLFGWLCDMYQTDGLKETINYDDIKSGYYASFLTGEIVPNGPQVDLNVPHNRNKKGFFNWVKADGSTDFQPEKGRYHLYVAMVCPFAGRALTVLKLKGLDDVISVCVLDSVKPATGEGWKFSPQKPGCDEDTVNGCKYLREVYSKANPNYTGSVSVPLLWDKKKNTAVNNESIDIMRMFNKEFNAFCPTEEQRNLDLLPDDMKDRIEDINSWVAPTLNTATFQAGRAPNQESYNKYVQMVFEGLDKAEALLSKHRYIAGNKMTEADVRLFVTIVRFDVAYYGAFKCNVKRIQDFPNLFGWLCDVYQTGNVKETINFDAIKAGVYGHIVPIGPRVNLNVPHNRDQMF